MLHLEPMKPAPKTNKILSSPELTAWFRENSCKYTYEQLMARFNLTTGTLRWALNCLNLHYKHIPSYIVKSPSKVRWLKANSHRYTVAQMTNIMLTERNVLRAALKKLGLKYLTPLTIWDKKEEVFQLRKAGTSFKDISAIVGLRVYSCRQICTDFDINPL